ncbi:MAG: putative phage abortive infection protein [Cytophagales bacterium]|nr:putative phage abortive infection protein [Cytophagales bacterium]
MKKTTPIQKLFSEKASLILVFLGIFLIALGLLLFLWNELQLSATGTINKEKFGQFGDFIGGLVGSIWALAGVILFYVALTEQRKDLKINQDVLKQQIAEFKLQRQELEETRQVFNLQKFDNTFFNLLKAQNDIVNSLFVDTIRTKTSGSKKDIEEKTHAGNRFFARALAITQDFYEQLPKFSNTDPNDLKAKYLNYFNKKYEEGIETHKFELLNNFNIDKSKSCHVKLAFFQFYVGFRSDFKKHLSHLSQILEYLDYTTTNNPQSDFSQYPKFLKAQLSDQEKLIIWLVTEMEGMNRSMLLKYEIFKGIEPSIDFPELNDFS